ncbi:MAG: recombinase family protein [Bacteroidota bacterium]
MSRSHHYFAYTRVSTVKQGEGVSLLEQKEAILRYANQNALTITRWFEEKVTAAKQGRPEFSQMLRELRKGTAAGVIMHKIDRSARNLKDWAELGELMDSGIDVQFVTDNLDMSSRGGRLSADIQAVVAADFIRNLKEETKKGFYGRLKQGFYPLPAPIGYLDKGKGLPKEIDPVKGPLVHRLFTLYTTGRLGLHALQKEANHIGLRTRNGGRISISGLSTMLNNPFYMGLIRIRKTGETFPGIHKPIIKASTFKRVQEVLAGKRNSKSLRHEFVYSKLFQCVYCGYSLIGETQKGHTYYRCHQKDCSTKGIREEKIGESLQKWLSLIQYNDEEAQLVSKAIVAERDRIMREQQDFLESYTLRIDQIDTRLNKLTDVFLDGDIDRDAYHLRKESLHLEKRELEEKKAGFEQDTEKLIRDAEDYLELARSAWLSYEMSDIYEKRQMLGKLTSNRKVDRKKVIIELKSPFQWIAGSYTFLNGDPFRKGPRTWGVICAELVKYIKDQ